MKKIIIIILSIVVIISFGINTSLAASNTKSIDLELSSSQYLSIADGSQSGLDITGDISIEGWIKIEQLPTSAGNNFVIASKDGSGDRGWVFYLSSSNNTGVFYYFEDNSAYTMFVTSSAVVVSGDVGSWVHIAVTVDVSTQSVIIYKNNSSFSGTTSPSGASSIHNNSAAFMIGQVRGGEYYDGLVDEVSVWSKVLSPTDVSDLYNSGNGKILTGSEASLEGYWRMEDNLLDETSNDNDLTNNNSATYSTDVPFEGVTDTCTYSGTGDWTVNLGDDCYVTASTYVIGDLILIDNTGAGYLNIIDGAILGVDSFSSTSTRQYINIESDDGSVLSLNNTRS